MTTITRLFLGLMAATTLVASAGVAHAGCNPACKAPEICRYEAAGGKFYCAAPKTKVNEGPTATPTGGVKPAAGSPATTQPSK